MQFRKNTAERPAFTVSRGARPLKHLAESFVLAGLALTYAVVIALCKLYCVTDELSSRKEIHSYCLKFGNEILLLPLLQGLERDKC